MTFVGFTKRLIGYHYTDEKNYETDNKYPIGMQNNGIGLRKIGKYEVADSIRSLNNTLLVVDEAHIPGVTEYGNAIMKIIDSSNFALRNLRPTLHQLHNLTNDNIIKFWKIFRKFNSIVNFKYP